jgi:transcriptional regulator with XRE-family HTH domain
MMLSAPAEVLSRPSNSRLAEVYKTDEFQNEWSNGVRFQVARNLLHLRRFRKMSQDAVASIMGTSQSAIARIESAQENITVDTLERHIDALRGRLEFSIPPQEHSRSAKNPWWDVPASNPWAIRGWAYWQGELLDQVIVGYERINNPRSYRSLESKETTLRGLEYGKEASAANKQTRIPEEAGTLIGA